ncbi:MAG: transposase [Acidobacteriota bacterium]|nr:transposase [Acidobacteriota bacterium]
MHPNAAGIDIGGSEHWVAISPERDQRPVRCFDCFTADLEQMADWLIERGVRSVATQSTRVYWIPVFEILQRRGLEVCLVNARHTKNLPGRKSDITECQWLLKLHTFGLLNNSFQPTDEIRAARTLWRHRAGLVVQAGSTIRRVSEGFALAFVTQSPQDEIQVTTEVHRLQTALELALLPVVPTVFRHLQGGKQMRRRRGLPFVKREDVGIHGEVRYE